MHLLVLSALLIAMLFFAYNQMAGLAIIVGLLILADLLGNIFSGMFGFAKGTVGALAETFGEEAAEVEASRPKPPSGQKFFRESLERTGKQLGKSEKLKAEGKRLPRAGIDTLASAADNFLTGLQKLFKK